GGAMSPFNAWVMVKGMETLDIRVRAQAATAAQVADALAAHANASGVRYPGRADHPQAALAQAQLTGGGTVLAFEVAGGKAGAFRFMNALNIVLISNNLGDAKSIATHPTTTTHQRLTEDQRATLGLSPGLIRLSIGLEDPADLIRDITQALDAV
ncbi:MAG: PLP-dependent transferase, partial [Pikeienuella sp.]